MAERVVDFLEVVEIDDHHADLVGLAHGKRDSLLEPILE
jgi:hypothetical protein